MIRCDLTEKIRSSFFLAVDLGESPVATSHWGDPGIVGLSMNTTLAEKLANLPGAPGVYLMKDDSGKILYVGKAADLKKRVASYFHGAPNKDLKTSVLMKKVKDLDTVITRTEKEAFLLESNLIKRHRPHYNVILKDDKRYPCLRLSIKSPYPNLRVARKIQKDGALYFGPFSSAGAVRETLRVIHRTFRLRKCRGDVLKRRDRPCLNFQMGLCLGPCSRPVEPERYRAVVDEVVLFLRGRTPELVERIRRSMQACSERLDFEAAAVHRDRLAALEQTLEKQTAVTTDFADRDVLGLARKGAAALVMMLFVRNGYLLGHRGFYFPEAVPLDQELLGSFVHQFYEQAPFVPKEILLPAEPEGIDLLEETLGEYKGEKVYLLAPKRGEKARILQLAARNAKKALEERLQAIEGEQGLLSLTQKRLALGRRPERIACLDLSNVAGTEGVGAIVVFDHGRPSRKHYRRYRIKSACSRDDYGMLREVLTRRYQKNQDPLPDLLVVDGGKGQLNAAVAVVKQMGLWGRLDVIGIAKKDPERGDAHDKVYRPGRKNPVNLAGAPQVLLFFQRIRDEAHRYVIAYHKKRRMISYRKSVLDGVPGIGEKRRQRLLKHFGSLKRIKAASLEEIAAVPGMTRNAAEALVTVLTQGGSNAGSTPRGRKSG